MLRILNNNIFTKTRSGKVLVFLFAEIPSKFSIELLPTTDSVVEDNVSVNELRTSVAPVKRHRRSYVNQSSLRLNESILGTFQAPTENDHSRKRQGISRIVQGIDFQFLIKKLYLPTFRKLLKNTYIAETHNPFGDIRVSCYS